MKITKRQLRRIIKEEKQALHEMWGQKEALSPLIAFAQDWASLGGAVQEQIVDVANGFVEGNEDAVYEINPNALDMAANKLRSSLQRLQVAGSEDADDMIEAIKWAEKLFRDGEQ